MKYKMTLKFKKINFIYIAEGSIIKLNKLIEGVDPQLFDITLEII